MDFSGRYTIPAPPKAVWAALRDPLVLAAAIPGCESVEEAGNIFTARAVLASGPAKTRFDAKVQLDQHVAPAGFTHAMTVKGEVRGGPAGFASGQSEVRLGAENGGTILLHHTSAILGGPLSQTEQSLLDGAAKTLTDTFFAKFAALMQTAPPAQALPAAKAAPDEYRNRAIAKPGRSEEGLAPQIWIAGLIGTVIILLILFGIVL